MRKQKTNTCFCVRKRTIVGEYNRLGYSLIHVEGMKELYHAGNHIQDSTQTVMTDSPDCIPLRQLRSFCIKTGKEMVKERGALWKWGGAERTDEEIDNA